MMDRGCIIYGIVADLVMVWYPVCACVCVCVFALCALVCVRYGADRAGIFMSFDGKKMTELVDGSTSYAVSQAT